jgi:hypothetical protein
MAYGKRLLAETIRLKDFGDIAATYSPIGLNSTPPVLGAPLEFPARLLLIQNYTDVPLMFSLNGLAGATTVDQFPLLAEGYILIDVMANTANPEGLFIAEGTTISVRSMGAAPASGSVYVSVFYAKGD